MLIDTPQSLYHLYLHHHRWLHDWLRRKLGDSFLADDLAQDTFVSIMAAETVQEIREPRPFLLTIARMKNFNTPARFS